jgi:hypothetical protein
MGDHVWEDADADAADSGDDGQGDGGSDVYDQLKKADLQAEVDRRNAERDEDHQVVVEGKGNVPDLIEALRADDQAAADQA